MLLSQRNIVNRKIWDEIMAKYESGEYVTGTGKEAVKGGLLADVMGIRCSSPPSQLSLRYVEKIEEFVGQELTLQIIEVDKAKKRIVASRKKVLIAEEAEKKKAIWTPWKSAAWSRALCAVWRTLALLWTSAAWTAWCM